MRSRMLVLFLGALLVIGSAFFLKRDPELVVAQSPDGQFRIEARGVSDLAVSMSEGEASTARLRPVYHVAPGRLSLPADVSLVWKEEAGDVALFQWEERFQSWTPLPTSVRDGRLWTQATLTENISVLQVQPIQVSEEVMANLLQKSQKTAPEGAVAGEFFLAHAFAPGDFVREQAPRAIAVCPDSSAQSNGESQTTFVEETAAVTLPSSVRDGVVRVVANWFLGEECPEALTLLLGSDDVR